MNRYRAQGANTDCPWGLCLEGLLSHKTFGRTHQLSSSRPWPTRHRLTAEEGYLPRPWTFATANSQISTIPWKRGPRIVTRSWVSERIGDKPPRKLLNTRHGLEEVVGSTSRMLSRQRSPTLPCILLSTMDASTPCLISFCAESTGECPTRYDPSRPGPHRLHICRRRNCASQRC